MDMEKCSRTIQSDATGECQCFFGRPAKQKRLLAVKRRVQKAVELGEAKHRQHLVDRKPALAAHNRKQLAARQRDVPKRLQQWIDGKEAHMAELERRNAEWGNTARRVS